MFAKTSRYRKLSDIVAIDAKGRSLKSKSLRLLPEVSGTFLHTIEEVDRLDHLAHKYYGESRRWWRLCDANPAFMSPQALLGKDAIATDRFPVTFHGDQAPWSDLRRALLERMGVEDVYVAEDIQLVPEWQTIDSEPVTVYVERFERAVIVTYNRMNVSAEDLSDVLIDAGFEVGQPEKIGRIGKPIIIPSNVVG